MSPDQEVQKAVLRAREAIRFRLHGGGWWSVAEMTASLHAAGIPAGEPSVSACIRDLRKPQYGGYSIEGVRGLDKVFRYRLKGVQA